MFKKKYIFETQRTKYFRYLKNLSSVFVIVIFGYIFLGFIILLMAEQSSKEAKEVFFKSPPDLIVVFTGAQGRIPFAFKMSKELHRPQIFITGVNSRNTVQTLISKIRRHSEFNPDMLIIDYGARNTFENVLATLGHLRNQKELKRILIVSHDYHLFRINFIMKAIKTKEDKYHFFYMGKRSDFYSFRSFKIIFKEVYKLIRTFFFLLMW